MSRELNKFRMVFTGISIGPAKGWVEYQVVDDDLKEPPKAVQLKGTNYEKTVGTLWKQKMETVKQSENIE